MINRRVLDGQPQDCPMCGGEGGWPGPRGWVKCKPCNGTGNEGGVMTEDEFRYGSSADARPVDPRKLSAPLDATALEFIRRVSLELRSFAREAAELRRTAPDDEEARQALWDRHHPTVVEVYTDALTCDCWKANADAAVAASNPGDPLEQERQLGWIGMLFAGSVCGAMLTFINRPDDELEARFDAMFKPIALAVAMGIREGSFPDVQGEHAWRMGRDGGQPGELN